MENSGAVLITIHTVLTILPASNP